MPRDGTATRQRILDTAERLVIDNGYSATSVDQVIAESGSSKGAFFHHFDSKADLARELVLRYAAADVGALRDALAEVAELDDPVARPIEFVRSFEVTADEVLSGQSSCLYVAVLTERQLAVAETAEPIRGAVDAWRDGFADLLRDAGLDDDAEDLALHLFATFEGAFILCRSTGEPHHLREQLRAYRRLLERALGRPLTD